MLTLVEAISLAGDRGKQNDDVCGSFLGRAWVIDGATDLHDAPATGLASDASWIAFTLNQALHRASTGVAWDEALMRAIVRRASEDAAASFQHLAGPDAPRWKLPTASMLIASERPDGLLGLDLGDCRCFALDADGAGHAIGGPAAAADAETLAARDAAKAAGGAPLLQHRGTLELLREKRAQHNSPEGYWVFGVQAACADRARVWSLPLTRPAHVLLATDGFASLVDRYGAYEPGGIVRAALGKGLEDLGREVRAIEAADSSGGRHPRWKRSDDATALLLRLT